MSEPTQPVDQEREIETEPVGTADHEQLTLPQPDEAATEPAPEQDGPA